MVGSEAQREHARCRQLAVYTVRGQTFVGPEPPAGFLEAVRAAEAEVALADTLRRLGVRDRESARVFRARLREGDFSHEEFNILIAALERFIATRPPEGE